MELLLTGGTIIAIGLVLTLCAFMVFDIVRDIIKGGD